MRRCPPPFAGGGALRPVPGPPAGRGDRRARASCAGGRGPDDGDPTAAGLFAQCRPTAPAPRPRAHPGRALRVPGEPAGTPSDPS